MKTREIRVYQDLMGENEKWAAEIRTLLVAHSVKMLNLIGSPGSGKTTLLEQTVNRLRADLPFGVLEGDVATTCDAERLDRLDVPVSQLLSGGSCHLEAKLVHHALRDFALPDLGLVFVENVGNMVCPAEFDIGEHAKVAVLSVTEGEEKPLKYPLLFREASAIVLTKIDLIPHLVYDLEACRDNIRQVHGDIPVFEVSSTTGEGVDAWCDWVKTFCQ
jgi:hydrogenase nickel incorporation protein HypB